MCEMCDDSIQNNRIIDKIAMFFIGAMNSAVYLISNYAFQNVLIYANLEKYYFIFFWLSVSIAIISRFLNSLFISLNFNYDLCIIVFLGIMQAGLLACSFAFSFWTVNVCIVLINFSASFFDSAILCYITKRRKQALLNLYAIGSGFTGLISAGYSYLCAKYDVSMFYTLIVFVFFPPAYGLLYYAVLSKSPQSNLPNSAYQNEDNNNTHEENNSENGIHQRMLDDLSENPHEKAGENQNNVDGQQSIIIQNNTIKNSEKKAFLCNMPIFRGSWILITSNFIVFFLYCSITGYIKLYGLKFEMENVYSVPFMYLCYQIGFFISICTIYFVQFHITWIFAIAQAILFIFSMCQTFLHFTKNLIFNPLMFIFGLCCGFPYINALYFLMNDDKKSTKEMEMSVSWNLFFISLSIILSKAFLYVFQAYYN
ncbi:hypothetical protein M9Y10_004287 [Tritrichomonas musculus]|uniref:Uncharacterized protein n=1 Tax=Tritrichomonas musculus TaxID=1915356 RepID=A0ABR2JS60_9EUKA